MLNDAFIGRLQCPQSGQVFRMADSQQLANINQQADAPWEAAIVTADGALAYPLNDGIPQLLPELAVKLSA